MKESQLVWYPAAVPYHKLLGDFHKFRVPVQFLNGIFQFLQGVFFMFHKPLEANCLFKPNEKLHVFFGQGRAEVPGLAIKEAQNER